MELENSLGIAGDQVCWETPLGPCRWRQSPEGEKPGILQGFSLRIAIETKVEFESILMRSLLFEGMKDAPS